MSAKRFKTDAFEAIHSAASGGRIRNSVCEAVVNLIAR